jgi:hypothetical protein
MTPDLLERVGGRPLHARGSAFLQSYWVACQIVEGAILVRAIHLELPSETNPRVCNVNDALFWKWGSSDTSQTRQFRDNDWPIEPRSWRRAVSHVSVNCPPVNDWPHDHVSGAISLRLRQDSQEGSLNQMRWTERCSIEDGSGGSLWRFRRASVAFSLRPLPRLILFWGVHTVLRRTTALS